MQSDKVEYEIVINALCKSWRGQPVLRDVSLLISAGEYLALAGVNGAGKTTLMKSILDFCEIDSGSIKLCGQAHTVPATRSGLAFLPERFAPPPHLSGKEFLQMMCSLYQVAYDPDQVTALVHMLDMETAALDKPIRHFSRGTSQKIGLLSVLLSRRKLLMLDEPMNGLDPRARLQFKQYLQHLKGRGYTLFFSTHLLADVEAICDRMAILHQGSIRFDGTPSQCLAAHGKTDLESAYLSCISPVQENEKQH